MPTSIFDVAKHIFELEKKKKTNKLDSLKLQKLCFYSQCLYLVLFDIPLFDEDFEKLTFGPLVESLRDEYNAYYDKNNKKYETDRINFQMIKGKPLQYPKEISVVETTFNMFITKSGLELSYLTLIEAPPTFMKLKDIMAKSTLKKHYSEDFKKLILFYKNATTYEVQDLVFKKIKDLDINNFSAWQVETIYIDLRVIEEDENNYIHITPKWKHQDKFSAFVSEILMPKQVISHQSLDIGYYSDPTFRRRIMFCAKSKYPLALFHLIKIIQFDLLDVETEEELDLPPKEKEEDIKKIKEWLIELTKELEKYLEEEEGDPYELGVLFILLLKYDRAKRIFEEKGKSCTKCQTALGDRTDDPEMRKEYYTNALKLDENNVYVDIQLLILKRDYSAAFNKLSSCISIVVKESPFALTYLKFPKDFKQEDLENLFLNNVKDPCVLSVLIGERKLKSLSFEQKKRSRPEPDQIISDITAMYELIKNDL
ncbi:hypothetical protein ABK040_006987 [Willaertia magna]